MKKKLQKKFLEIIKLFLIDKEIPEFTQKNRILIREFFNCFPDFKDQKLINLVEELKKQNQINQYPIIWI